MATRIHKDAAEKINRLLVKTRTEHRFSSNEASFKILEMQEKRVVFLIHERLKNLLALCYDNDPLNKVVFSPRDKQFWKITIESGGIESYYFGVLLEEGLKKLDEQKKNLVLSNKENIKNVITSETAHLSKDVVQQNVFYRKGSYFVKVTVNKIFSVEYEDSDAAAVCSMLKDKLPTLVQIANGKKKK